ncbi:hypothetical protein B7L51_005970 [Pectobacterium brasiliense]|nr:hypothetical protein [Pectobacterium carotovorum]OYN52173.1 hypothetical protein B7L51_06025 [Pectobacterium carotovorum]
MNSISTFVSNMVADSGQGSRARNSQTEQQNVANSKTVFTGKRIERQVVEISQEALTKFQEYTAKQKVGDTASEQPRTAEGARVGQPGYISEEDQTRLMEAMLASSLEEYLGVLDEVSGNLSSVTKQIDQIYSAFLDQLAEDHPDLKGAFFGFSVNKDGTLSVTQSGDLNREQVNRLEKVLNGSDELVALANDLVDAQIAVFNTIRGANPEKTLNRDNYSQTIDMGIDLLTRHLARSAPRDGSASEVHKRNWDSNWYNQL